jgi:hypothetical protein
MAAQNQTANDWRNRFKMMIKISKTGTKIDRQEHALQE